jgi:hypothetical protein
MPSSTFEGDALGIARLVLEYTQALVWPLVAVIAMLLFRKHLVVVLQRLKGADLPGGVSLDFNEEIRDAKELSREVQDAPPHEKDKGQPSIPLTEANARMISVGLQPSPSGLDLSYYRNLARQDPNVALAGLRMEVEILARNLAKGFGIEIQRRDSAGMILRRLHDNHAITLQQNQLAQKIVQLCNAAVHGTRVSREEADEIIDLAMVLGEQYVRWLSWGFNDGWQPAADRNQQRLDDGRA